MNDPHVKALIYRVTHPNNVDYTKAPPLEHREVGFHVRIDDGKLEIELVDHYATEEEARTVVEPFLHAWVLSASLQYGPGEIRFVYDRPEIIDRRPTPGSVHISGRVVARATPCAIMQVGRTKYPDPPVGIARDAAVDLMFERYCRYRAGRTTLPDAANYCLTVLERTAGNRKKAAYHFGVAESVLRTLGELAARKGGKEARKFDGSQSEFTSAERAWLQKTLTILIRRAAETAFDPDAMRPQIKMADLPRLQDD